MIAMYAHNGSGNHGCEAIVRSTIDMLNEEFILYSGDVSQDRKFDIDKICSLKECGKSIKLYSAKHAILKINSMISHNLDGYTKTTFKNLLADKKNAELYLSIGGDNYCYKGMPEQLSYINKKICEFAPTVLWGCSIDEEALQNPSVIADLNKYSLITVREHITRNLLKQNGVTTRLVLCADPAFTLKPTEIKLSKIFSERRVIGINVSPMIYRYGDGEIIDKSVKKLVDYIVTNTDYGIAWISHVEQLGNSDEETMRKFAVPEERCVYVKDLNCCQLKYIISNCEMFIGARTHATIAAYSSCVPTAVIGYSVKARGIASDIYKDKDHFLLPVQDLKKENSLIEMFQKLNEQKDSIREYLNSYIPEYINTAYEGSNALMELIQ